MAAASKITVTPPGDQPRLALYPAGQPAEEPIIGAFPSASLIFPAHTASNAGMSVSFRFPVADPLLDPLGRTHNSRHSAR